ncbi:MAG: glycosyltransferase 87 family protein [Bacteroidia bacterium]
MKQVFIKCIPFVTVAIVLVMLLSLHFGWLNKFSFDSEYASVQGIDYFAVPKSFLNLMEGRSIFDTWGGTPYGPRATWYLAHPAFSVFVASWFSFFPPWISYWLFIVFSIAILAYCAYFIAKASNKQLNKYLTYFLMLCAFPVYWMLYVGNMQAPLVLALGLLLVAVYELTYSESEADTKAANQKLMAGLLISFFSKPIVLLMLPVLLFTKETRRTTIVSLIIYAIVSFLFIVVPVLNPQGVGLEKLFTVMFDFDYIKENMNIYKNGYKLNEYMKDNSIHWLNLIAQSEYKFMHIDVFSLPVFVDTYLNKSTSASIYKLPIYLSLFLSVGVALIKDKKTRLESTLLLIMAISLSFFLSYNTVWEYQYTSALPVMAMMPILLEKDVFYRKYIKFILIIGAFIYLPSLYFLVRKSNFESLEQTIIRLNRVVPVLLMFLIMITVVAFAVKKHASISVDEDDDANNNAAENNSSEINTDNAPLVATITETTTEKSAALEKETTTESTENQIVTETITKEKPQGNFLQRLFFDESTTEKKAEQTNISTKKTTPIQAKTVAQTEQKAKNEPVAKKTNKTKSNKNFIERLFFDE